jgi:hypothetical protein
MRARAVAAYHLELCRDPRQCHGVPHTTNRSAFRDCDASEPSFRLYTLLVAIELALKDKISPFRSGHDLHRLAGFAVTPMSPGLSTQLTGLTACLGVLLCTSLQGLQVPIDPANYPGLRYIRHDRDFPGASSETSVKQALDTARQLVQELRLAGVEI